LSDEQYTLRELAALAQVTPRTIRYYTAEGLLPPPEARGRYARYGAEHLRRLQQIAQLKADYLPLQVIKERLAPLGAAALPSEMGRSTLNPGQQRSAPWMIGPSHLAERRGGYGGGEAAGPRMQAELPDGALIGPDPFRLGSQPQVGRIEFFPHDSSKGGEEDLGRLAKMARERAEAEARRDEPLPLAATEVWRCLVVAPGIEVRLREPIAERQRLKVEAMVAALRDELLRGEGE
jgi:DNA-binding transcriptional MerR regulator